MGIYHEAELPAGRVGMSGFFEIRGRKPDGRERIIAPMQKNLITDAGLDRLGVGDIITNCHLGSGTTAAEVGDTALESWVATTSSKTTTSGDVLASKYSWRTHVFTFAPAASAYVASEIGVGWSATNDSLWARALVRDAWGAPLNAVIEAGETVVVKYEYHYHWWTGDVPFEILVFGEVYDGVMRPAEADTGGRWPVPTGPILMAATGPLYPIACSAAITTETSVPSAGSTAAAQLTAPAYVSGSHKRIGSYQWTTGVANFADGIKSIAVRSTSSWYQMGFTHPTDPTKGILKTASNSLILNVTTPVWGRMA